MTKVWVLYGQGGYRDIESIPEFADGVRQIVEDAIGSGGAPGTGSSGKDGATWTSGEGEPAASAGAEGDHYLDTLSGDVYRRGGGAWAAIANIVGPQGDPGIGEPGPPGASVKGDKGDKGDPGGEPLVLAANEPIPVGTPTNTLIVRKS